MKMKNKLKLAKILRRWSDQLVPIVHIPEPQRSTDAAVEADIDPIWSPRQEGNVIVAEPKIISLERQRIGEDGLQKMYDES